MSLKTTDADAETDNPFYLPLEYLEDAGLNPQELMLDCSGEKMNDSSEETHGTTKRDSFSMMIRKSLEASPRQRMYINEIYTWIFNHYPHIKYCGHNNWRVHGLYVLRILRF